MKKLRIGILEVLYNTPADTMYAKIMRVNTAGIMPQVLAVWLEQAGHEVHITHYSGPQNLFQDLPEDLDVIFFSAFTTSAQVAYALSNYYRSKGVITVLGGPHARSYPEDCAKYFDYVLGFTDRELVEDVIHFRSNLDTGGVYLSAEGQPAELPSLQERWKYAERLLSKAPFLKIVPMIGSLGCPYKCSFCIDSEVNYQPLSFDQLKSDLRFLLTKFKKPVVGWHDPNFGIRFEDYLGAIEESVPKGSMTFIAESSMSLLTEPNVKRMKENGFSVMLPGIESWFDMGNKSRMRKTLGLEKLHRISEQVNMIQSYIPYMQANFVLGLDMDEGDEPFELTKQFVDLCPGVFPTYNLLTSYGRSVPLNLTYQRDERLIHSPFHLMNNDKIMNVKPLNYEWPEFYKKLLSLFEHTFSKKAVANRFISNKGFPIKMMNFFRANTQGKRHIQYYKDVIDLLENDTKFRAFYEGESSEIPDYFKNMITENLGPLAEWLPEGAMNHDPYAYLKSVESDTNKLYQPGVMVGS